MRKEELMDKICRKVYLGDGIYIEYDGYQFTLRTQRDEGEHRIHLDAYVMRTLEDHLMWVKGLIKEYNEEHKDENGDV